MLALDGEKLPSSRRLLTLWEDYLSAFPLFIVTPQTSVAYRLLLEMDGMAACEMLLTVEELKNKFVWRNGFSGSKTPSKKRNVLFRLEHCRASL
jgi:hypothetical protein